MVRNSAYGNKPVLLIALGGNALIQKGQAGTISEQFANLREPIRQIASLANDYRITITHGNGPQVGNLLLQQESCEEVSKLPLEILVAQTQGQIGYMLESALDEALMAPKVAAAMQFVKKGGTRAVITSVESICDSIKETAGTQVTLE
jgi:carbamate kinase